ncbi:triacylglycerol lipase [Nocardiopsis sp. SBT366]|uniref:esterase/lipase family protein n=1 Tax=Nocardiopsis sp. SBT366 TaxID=1580529 RepID=UPI001F26AC14|nr:hypothetical protein [Nocardiopsis sp. SBT366]
MTDQQQPVVEPFGFLAPTPPALEPAPTPDDTWEIPGGTAWVYLSDPGAGLRRPVILSDGFESGPSDLDRLWGGLERGDYAFITELRRRGHDLVLVGYDDRSASILRNAETVTQVVFRAIGERRGDAPLAVGGFSMGGLVTRYALAKMESDGIDHQTALYLSFDSPHRGAWVPVGLQAFAHFLKATPALSRQINSAAARQLLWRHVESVDAEPVEDALRTEPGRAGEGRFVAAAPAQDRCGQRHRERRGSRCAARRGRRHGQRRLVLGDGPAYPGRRGQATRRPAQGPAVRGGGAHHGHPRARRGAGRHPGDLRDRR